MQQDLTASAPEYLLSKELQGEKAPAGILTPNTQPDLHSFKMSGDSEEENESLAEIPNSSTSKPDTIHPIDTVSTSKILLSSESGPKEAKMEVKISSSEPVKIENPFEKDVDIPRIVTTPSTEKKGHLSKEKSPNTTSRDDLLPLHSAARASSHESLSPQDNVSPNRKGSKISSLLSLFDRGSTNSLAKTGIFSSKESLVKSSDSGGKHKDSLMESFSKSSTTFSFMKRGSKDAGVTLAAAHPPENDNGLKKKFKNNFFKGQEKKSDTTEAGLGESFPPPTKTKASFAAREIPHIDQDENRRKLSPKARSEESLHLDNTPDTPFERKKSTPAKSYPSKSTENTDNSQVNQRRADNKRLTLTFQKSEATGGDFSWMKGEEPQSSPKKTKKKGSVAGLFDDTKSPDSANLERARFPSTQLQTEDEGDLAYNSRTLPPGGLKRTSLSEAPKGSFMPRKTSITSVKRPSITSESVKDRVARMEAVSKN